MKRFAKKHSFLSFLLLTALIAAMLLSVVACNDTKDEKNSETESQSVVETPNTVLGEGSLSFTFEVVFGDKTTKTYTIKTDAETVGEALQDVELISGTVGDFGLMVESVAGETHVYANDGTYWAFYVNGEYAMTGVDSAEVENGATYAFKVEK